MHAMYMKCSTCGQIGIDLGVSSTERLSGVPFVLRDVLLAHPINVSTRSPYVLPKDSIVWVLELSK